MASPYDSAIEMFSLPRYGAGTSPFMPVRREDPATAARRRFLEGGSAQEQTPEAFVQERASMTDDPFGVMQEVENLRKEREEQSFISDIAALDPSQSAYSKSLLELVQKNPQIAQSRGALSLIDVQRKLAPDIKDYTSQFRDPLYRASYQDRVKSGLAPEEAYNQTLNEAANEEMAIKLIEAGVPEARHGDLMTGGIFDRRKVAQAIADRGKDLPRTELNELLKLASDYQKSYADPITWAEPQAREKGGEYDTAAKDWFRRSHEGQEPSTPQDWEAAYYGLREERTKTPLSAWNQRLAAIEGQYRIPDEIRSLVGGAPRPVQTAPAPVQDPTGIQPPTPVQAVPEPSVSVPQAIPAGPKAASDQLDQLWKEYEDLESVKSVDADSTNPSDVEADREINAELNRLREQLIKAYGWNEREGNMRFRSMKEDRKKYGEKDYSYIWGDKKEAS